MAIFAADIGTQRRSDWTLPVALFGLYAAFLVIALHPTAFAMAQTWLSSSSYHHGIVVAPLALLMISSLPRIAPATSFGAVFAVAAGALFWLAGRAAGVALIEEIALVSLLIAGAGVFFGAAALRIWALPLAFLYFMVPFGELLTPALQTLTAASAVALLNGSGIHAAIDGLMIKTDAGLFHIAEACAGLNFLLAALMIAFVYAIAVLHETRARVIFVAIAIVLALAANAVRAGLLIAMATLSNMQLAVGADHLVIGIVFYGFVFLVLMWIGARLRKNGPRREPAPITARRNWRAPVAILAFTPIIGASLYASFVVAAAPDRTTPAQLSPISVSGWRILPGPENWRPALKADRTAAITYRHGQDSVYVTLGYTTYDRAAMEVVNSGNRSWDGENWRRIAAIDEPIFLFGALTPATFDVLAGPERRRLLALTIYWRGDQIFLDPKKYKLAQMRDKLRGVQREGGVIFIASDYRGAPEEALKKIHAFLNSAEPFGKWRARNGGAG